MSRRAGLVALLTGALLAGALAAATPAMAQSAWTHRARVTFEGDARTGSGDLTFIGSADSSWDNGGRLKIGGGLIVFGASGGGVSVGAREAYARVSVTPWMDVEAGKRLLRWGVGYGFAPTGVLDPPRQAGDPTDRLGRNEGLPLARIDLFRGGTSLTIAAAAPTLWRDDAPAGASTRMLAARLRTVIRGGLEVSLIATAAPGRRAAAGGNVTHVVGQRLEWHAELLSHDDGAGGRTSSAVAGIQYTLPGVNVVMEYHRHSGHLLFVRAARAAADVAMSPELIVVRQLDDGGWTMVAGLGWMVQRRLEIYGRITLAGHDRRRQGFGGPPLGAKAEGPPLRLSESLATPARSRVVTAGATFRF